MISGGIQKAENQTHKYRKQIGVARDSGGQGKWLEGSEGMSFSEVGASWGAVHSMATVVDSLVT